MSSTNKTANYQLSQFVGNDIPSILNDYNGDMRKIDTAIKDVANAGGDNATAVAELQATVGQHTTEIGGINSTVNSLSGRVIGIEGKIPASASEQNKLLTAEDLPEIPEIGQLEQDVAGLQNNVAGLQSNVAGLQDDVSGINSVIPANASASNKLVTRSDIPDVPSLDELETRVGKCETNIEDIDAVIPENASAENMLATIDDIESTGAILVLEINDVANPTQSELAQIQEFYNKYASHKNDYIFFMWNGIFYKNLENLSVGNNRIQIETFDVDSSSSFLDFFSYSITLNTNSAGTIYARNYSLKTSGITIEESSGYDTIKIAVIPVN